MGNLIPLTKELCCKTAIKKKKQEMRSAIILTVFLLFFTALVSIPIFTDDNASAFAIALLILLAGISLFMLYIMIFNIRLYMSAKRSIDRREYFLEKDSVIDTDQRVSSSYGNHSCSDTFTFELNGKYVLAQSGRKLDPEYTGKHLVYLPAKRKSSDLVQTHLHNALRYFIKGEQFYLLIIRTEKGEQILNIFSTRLYTPSEIDFYNNDGVYDPKP